ncbi:MAG: SDR family oxidoreductase [Actinomycetota bacterium]|nr:SDR family oxidoreductase [Actinomycetota bacterium]
MSVSIDLSGRHGFVTGAGSGIGRAVAQRLAEAGAAVGAADVRREAAEETASLIEQAGGKAVPIAVDVTSWDDCREVASRTEAELGPVDVLVNGAAVWTVAKFLDVEPQDWARDIEVGLEGALQVTRAFLPALVERQRGSIVNVSSDAGRVGEPQLVVYSAVKAGVVGFTKALAKEVGRFGVRVNCVAPGTTRTPGAEGLIELWGEEKMARAYPLGRLGEPIDIANAILFLASDLSDWITGQVLSVSGGYSTAG